MRRDNTEAMIDSYGNEHIEGQIDQGKPKERQIYRRNRE